MTRSAAYPPADQKVQSFSSAYRGSPIQPNTLVLHTTEGPLWPTYDGGAVAPHLTGRFNARTKKMDWRQHFPLTMSSRSLVNAPGGVETNTLNVVQVELVGTCNPATQKSMFYWPEAPDEALQGVAEFITFLHEEWALQFKAPKLWLPYPESYGQTKARMSFKAWNAFYGVCGHQHVPENVHGDPGHLDINKILAFAKGGTTSTPKKTDQATDADAIVKMAKKHLDRKNITKARAEAWTAIHDQAKALIKE